MIRKVNKVGKDTLTVSLPSRWVKKQGLQKGDDLSVDEEAKSLILSLAQPKLKEKEIDLKEFDFQFTKLVLNNFYRMGYERLIIYFQTVEQYQVIQELANNHFLGFEILKKTKDKCIVENIAEPGEEKAEKLLRIIFLNIIESFATLVEDLKNEEHTLLILMDKQFEKTDQLVNFCLKTTKKYDLSDSSYLKYLLIQYLLVLEGELRHLYKYIQNHKTGKVKHEIIAAAEEALKVFKEYHECFYAKDLNKLDKVNKRSKSLLYEKLYRTMENAKKEDIVILYGLSAFTRQMTLLISPTVGVIQK